jgi:hypothetical protein
MERRQTRAGGQVIEGKRFVEVPGYVFHDSLHRSHVEGTRLWFHDANLRQSLSRSLDARCAFAVGLQWMPACRETRTRGSPAE